MLNQHTSKLSQYGVIVGRRMLQFKRPPLGSKKYREPRFIGVTWHRSKAAALEAKAQFDRPLH